MLSLSKSLPGNEKLTQRGSSIVKRDAVLQVSVTANQNLYDDLKRRYQGMCDALMTLMKPEIDDKVAKEKKESVEETRLESIRNIMKTLKLKPKEAMDALLIPDSERAKYIARL